MIVKFRDSVTGCIDCALREGRPLSETTADGSDSLEDLRSRLGVLDARPVFPQFHGRTLDESKRLYSEDLQRANAALSEGRLPPPPPRT